MSDTEQDLHEYKIARQLEATRDPSPCEKYSEMSKTVPFCDDCGWNEDAHVDRDHDVALDMDAEFVQAIEDRREYDKEVLKGIERGTYTP